MVYSNIKSLFPNVYLYEKPVAVVALNHVALNTARRILCAFPQARLHSLANTDYTRDNDVIFSETVLYLQSLFKKGYTIIGICASGLLIRALGSVLSDKNNEPPVVSVATDGSAIIPLVGGHHGANRLSRALGMLFDVIPAITTCGDTYFGFSLDETLNGWCIKNPEFSKIMTTTLTKGQQINLQTELNLEHWLPRALYMTDPSNLSIQVTDHSTTPNSRHKTLTFYPPTLVVGIGCTRDVPSEDLLRHVFLTLIRYNLAPQSVAIIASIDLKMNELAVLTLSQILAVPARFLSAEELELLTPRLMNPSNALFQRVGCHGVAEAAALATSGPQAVLEVGKQRTKNATCAIVRTLSDVTHRKKERGQLYIIGIGPGTMAWRTPEASEAIAAANHLVGYALYLDLLGPMTIGKVCHDSPLGTEMERVCLSLDLAAVGETVALICSGDAGIYALATLVFEIVTQSRRIDWNQVNIQVIPGVSVFQAAAACVGAPLGNDFCVLSLSDLLTPWPVILRRLAVVASADFVVAIYNPISQHRQSQLTQARDILLTHRSTNTPVIVARNLGRSNEHVIITSLDKLNCEQVDMLTIILVGNSKSRSTIINHRTFIYTPRGYTSKPLS